VNEKVILEDQPNLTEVRSLLQMMQTITAPKDALPTDGPATIQQVAAYF